MESQVATNVEILPIAGALGAELHGIDLTQPITDDIFKVIHDALVEHQVIFFRDQDIQPEHHLALAERFGEPHTHPAYPNPEGFPAIVKLISTPEKPTKIEKWHTDMTFMEKPPLGSILHAKEIPAHGGDTIWSNMELAYEALSDKWQSFLSGLSAVHDFQIGFKESLAEPGGRERLKQAILDNPPVEHPVIRKHPVSGRKCIFVNSLFTSHIVGMSELESKYVLEFVYEHVQNPDFNCRFRWQKNSIAFWDNRSTQHKPVNDYFPNYREMWRITILGDKPMG
ncbi:MAG: taurine dioxygenase [Flavobacteriales bacterium]|nr:taurine dioxygenase [Flavobacteriales bacterium]